MPSKTFRRSAILAHLFLKEQFKEPTAILWTIISPCLLFYLLGHPDGYGKDPKLDYLQDSAWFYAYIASSVGFFGFALYIIGRRESGFIRSFIYSNDSKKIFLTAQFIAYSCIALIYCCIFYTLTKSYRNELQMAELLNITLRFYACFLIFCSMGLMLTLAPLNFQNANTIFSILLFIMIALGVSSSNLSPTNSMPLIHSLNQINPLQIATKIMRSGFAENIEILTASIISLTLTLLFSFKYLRINPVWSRY